MIFSVQFEEGSCLPGEKKEVGCKFCKCMLRGLGYLCSDENCKLTNGNIYFSLISFLINYRKNGDSS